MTGYFWFMLQYSQKFAFDCQQELYSYRRLYEITAHSNLVTMLSTSNWHSLVHH